MSRPWRKGEFAARAWSSGRCRRRPLKARIAVSASGIPTWMCSPPTGVADGVAEQVADPLVALLVGDLRLALARRRVGARPEQARPGGEHRAAQPAERARTASPALRQTSVISSTWQACSSRSTVPDDRPSRSSTAAEVLIWRPVTGSTRNSSSSTPTENGSPEPNSSPISSSPLNPDTIFPAHPRAKPDSTAPFDDPIEHNHGMADADSPDPDPKPKLDRAPPTRSSSCCSASSSSCRST